MALALVVTTVVGCVLLAIPDSPEDQALRPGSERAAAPVASASAGSVSRTTNGYDAVSGWSLPAGAVARRAADITRTLRRLNEALRGRDRTAFASVADPLVPGFAQRQRRTFDALASLPVTPTYAWQGEWSAVTVPQGHYRRPYVVAAVTRVYRLPGWDRAPVAEQLALTFMFDGDAWVLASDTDGREPGGATRQEPWAAGPVRTASTRHVLVIGRGFSVGRLNRLAERTESSVRDVGAAWPGAAWNGKAVVYAVRDPAFLDGWFGLEKGRSGQGAAGDAGPVAGDSDPPAEFEALVEDVPAAASPASPAVAAGVRLVVSPELVTTADAQHVRAVLRHEVGHLAIWTGRAPVAPVWLSEGVAEYLAWRDTDASGRVDPITALERRGLPGPMWATLRRDSYRPVLRATGEEFYRGSGAEVARNYADAWLVVTFLAHQYGERELRRFVQAAQAGSGTGGAATAGRSDGAEAAAAALAATYGFDGGRLRRDAGAFARDLRSRFP
jgi:hypothetical protein